MIGDHDYVVFGSRLRPKKVQSSLSQEKFSIIPGSVSTVPGLGAVMVKVWVLGNRDQNRRQEASGSLITYRQRHEPAYLYLLALQRCSVASWDLPLLSDADPALDAIESSTRRCLATHGHSPSSSSLGLGERTARAPVKLPVWEQIEHVRAEKDGQRPRAAVRKTLKLPVQALLCHMHSEKCVMVQTRRYRLLYFRECVGAFPRLLSLHSARLLPPTSAQQATVNTTSRRDLRAPHTRCVCGKDPGCTIPSAKCTGTCALLRPDVARAHWENAAEGSIRTAGTNPRFALRTLLLANRRCIVVQCTCPSPTRARAVRQDWFPRIRAAFANQQSSPVARQNVGAALPPADAAAVGALARPRQPTPPSPMSPLTRRSSPHSCSRPPPMRLPRAPVLARVRAAVPAPPALEPPEPGPRAHEQLQQTELRMRSGSIIHPDMMRAVGSGLGAGLGSLPLNGRASGGTLDFGRRRRWDGFADADGTARARTMRSVPAVVRALGPGERGIYRARHSAVALPNP
ncbi:hypothetical protein B0H17DRAFT_1145341 [Mycena rosella]|uniref:Uncharacterized protein n=1 Tax=Mycena rosella TaxID=1033263 RepID=A0AAD7CRB1_MYCRO|nr:hypothetical protein B0H17DRAFT_1145341 [Mycena rosella]